MFKPVQTGGNVFGTPSSDLMERYNDPLAKNNDKPFQEQYVGPGLGLDYNENPKGGYQQLDTLMYARPRSVDILRTKNNPKKTYTEPTVPGTIRNPNNTGVKPPLTKHKKQDYFVNRKQFPTGA